ncbi:FkbM family methyltransferase [Methanobrevibacter millerae]|uniref:Methyltransferase FkbM family n=1 Tax=Methanobrevibacter millerae TaxID=230361 RepID=A0A0U3DTN0_9EURY|nr:FkbM family methyltransferase [Methanobrevibacter millerae]ALT69290.1 methyltransferase FkbM family [Methanobrevibacter millerae]
MVKKIDYLLDYFNYLENPIQCLLFKFNLKKEVNVKFKNSTQEHLINDTSTLDKIMSLIPKINKNKVDEFALFITDLCSSKDIIPWAGVNIFNFRKEKQLIDETPFYEYYMGESYSSFNINYKNRVVIDIGSYVGDTALFFANQGASVYGFEPVKKNYEYSLELKKINPDLNEKLHFFNYGVSDKIGTISIDDMNSTSQFRTEKDHYEVEVITLEDILTKNQIKPDILKMDCEGCEFNIILNTDLSNFKDIIFEHHSIHTGIDHKLLIEKLKKQGFNIILKPTSYDKFEDAGLIHAYKD